MIREPGKRHGVVSSCILQTVKREETLKKCVVGRQSEKERGLFVCRRVCACVCREYVRVGLVIYILRALRIRTLSSSSSSSFPSLLDSTESIDWAAFPSLES